MEKSITGSNALIHLSFYRGEVTLEDAFRSRTVRAPRLGEYDQIIILYG
jgi:hypothetical protein